MRRFVGAAVGLCMLAACGSPPPAAAPKASAPTPSASASVSVTPTPLTGPMPPVLHVDPKYLPSWMRGMAANPDDQVSKAQASIGMLRVQSALAQHGLAALQDLPSFPQRVVRQCTALNAKVADPVAEAIRSFSIPQRPLSKADARRVNQAIRTACV